MENRDTIITSIRPQIESDKNITLALEKFQNENLRPILKFQNELILQAFQQTLFEFKVDFAKLSVAKKQAKINEILKENLQIKQFYLGLIIAFFTSEEFQFYSENKKEIHKRISSLLIERVGSQLV
jgi:predicted type IV restriction endonuclease